MIRTSHSIGIVVLIWLLAPVSAGQQPSPIPGRTGQSAQPRRQSQGAKDATGTGASISGKVLVDGQTLAGVRITINPVGPSSNLMNTLLGRFTVDDTGDDGKFRFDGLRSGAYTLRPMLTGYVVESGVLDDNSQPIYYRPGDFATIKMVKGGVITGRVFGESVLVGVPVRAIRVKDAQGRRTREVTLDLIEEMQPSTTDDRGIYRIYGLEPGTYVVCAGGSISPETSGPFDNDSPVYHPGGAIAAALEVTVRAGQDASGIDINYRELGGHSISGTLGGRIPSGWIYSGAAIMLTDASTGALQAVRLALGEASDRVYAFSGVPDGKYQLTAIGGLSGDEMTAAPPRKVSVQGSNVTGIDLVLGPIAEISGRVVLETPPEVEPRPECKAKPPAEIDQSVILARGAGDQAQRGSLGPFFSRPDEALPNDKGEFKLRLISSGVYYLETRLPGDDLYIRSISLPALPDGRPARNPVDGLDVRSGEKIPGVTITIARGAAGLAGRVVAPNSEEKAPDKVQITAAPDGKPPDKSQANAASDARPADKSQMTGGAAIRLPDRLQVIAVPAEPEAATDLLRYAESTVGPDGSFAFSNMAPGRYYLVTRVMPDEEWSNPGSLPDWFNIDQRKKLHREAKKADVVVELGRCRAVKEYELRYTAISGRREPRGSRPPTPPYIRFRIRRFMKYAGI